MNTKPTLILFTIFVITKVSISQFIRGPTSGTWTEAFNYCNENARGLAVITSAWQNAAASAACNTPSPAPAGCWTGLIVSDISGAPSNCKWVWEDSTPVSYGFTDGIIATMPDPAVWGTGEPNICNTENHMAIEIMADYGWVDISGSAQFGGNYPFPLCKI
eukprot:531393_1